MKRLNNEILTIDEITSDIISALRQGGCYVAVQTSKGAVRDIAATFTYTYADGHENKSFDGFKAWTGRRWEGLSNELAQVFDPDLYERRQERHRKAREPHTLNVGDIFYTSWGYEQTNSEFFEIVKTTPKTVTVREIAHIYEPTEYMQGRQVPALHKYIGEPINRAVKKYGERFMINVDDVRTGFLWDGLPVGVSSYY